MLIIVGMFLDGVSIFLIFVPLLLPIAQTYNWDPVWFGVDPHAEGRARPVHAAAGGQPDGLVPHRRRRMEETVRWVVWLLFAMFLVMVAVLSSRNSRCGCRAHSATDRFRFRDRRTAADVHPKETTMKFRRSLLGPVAGALAAALAA